MARGGARPGAGRPKGSQSRRTTEFDALYDKLVKKYGDPVEALFALGFADGKGKEPAVDAVHRVSCLRELARLRHPTKKAVEVQGDVVTEVHIIDPTVTS